MLQETCPICKTPLFELKGGDVICPQCNRRVFIVKDEAERRSVLTSLTVQGVEETVASKLEALNERLKMCDDLDEMYDILKLIIAALDVIERAKKLQK